MITYRYPSKVVTILSMFSGLWTIRFFSGMDVSDNAMVLTGGEAVLVADNRYIEDAEKLKGVRTVLNDGGLFPLLERLFSEAGVKTVAVNESKLTFSQYEKLSAVCEIKKAASELFADRMTLDRKTKVAFYDMPAVSGLESGRTGGSPGLLKERATGAEQKKHDLYMLLANMAEEMGVEIVYSPERHAADYTEVFRHKLKGSWQYAPGLISDMEG